MPSKPDRLKSPNWHFLQLALPSTGASPKWHFLQLALPPTGPRLRLKSPNCRYTVGIGHFRKKTQDEWRSSESVSYLNFKLNLKKSLGHFNKYIITIKIFLNFISLRPCGKFETVPVVAPAEEHLRTPLLNDPSETFQYKNDSLRSFEILKIK